MIQPLDAEGRWWRVGSYEVDLNAEALTYPPHVRAAALARRDADDDYGRDVAALAEALATGELADPAAERMVTQWLFDQSQRIVARMRERLHRLQGGQREHAA